MIKRIILEIFYLGSMAATREPRLKAAGVTEKV